MKEITNDVIQLLENDNLDKDYWYGQLGYADSITSEKSLNESDLIYNFYEQGKYLWGKYKHDLRYLICDLEKGEPKLLVGELIGGDIRSLLETLVPLIIAQFSVGVAVAVPLACLMLKIKLKKLCSLDWEG